MADGKAAGVRMVGVLGSRPSVCTIMKVTPRLSSFGKQYNQDAEYENGQLMFNGVLILIATALMKSCATEPYVVKEDEEIFGTWIRIELCHSVQSATER
jgi:hypothetical protein